MVSTSGSQLLPEQAVSVLIRDLLPSTTILTPNLPEALLILKVANSASETPDPQSVDDLVSLARKVQKLGSRYVLLKGGHLPLTKDRRISDSETDHHTVIDILVGGDTDQEVHIFESEYVKSKNTHGTGCSLASAIACNLALGEGMQQAVQAASHYVEAGIRTSRDLGKGNGPINHFHSSYNLPFSPGHFISYLLSRNDVKPAWHDYTHHSFVTQMADGTLPLSKFKNYLIQDYLFLIQFARANALAAYKSRSLTDIQNSAKIVQHIIHETNLHVTYCQEEFGLSIEDITSHPEHQACTAYTRYVLDVGQSEDWFALQIALLPCLLGYGEIAKRLHADSKTKREGNKYWKWIANYVEEDYVSAVELGKLLVEKHAVRQSVYRIEELVEIFVHATKMETGFWDMGSL